MEFRAEVVKGCNNWLQEKQEGVVNDRSRPQSRFIDWHERQAEREQKDGNDNLRIILVKVVFELPKLDFHAARTRCFIA